MNSNERFKTNQSPAQKKLSIHGTLVPGNSVFNTIQPRKRKHPKTNHSPDHYKLRISSTVRTKADIRNIYLKRKPIDDQMQITNSRSQAKRRISRNTDSSIFRSAEGFADQMKFQLVKIQSNQSMAQAPKQQKKMQKKNQLNLEISNYLSYTEFDYYRILLLRSNGLQVISVDRPFKYYLGPGNNDLLIQKIMQTRPWWVRTESMHRAQFIWTQCKKHKIYDILPTLKLRKVKEAIIEYRPSSIDGLGLIQDSEFLKFLKVNRELDTRQIKLYNKLEKSNQLCSKKLLFANIYQYYKRQGLDPFTKIPLTFHIVNGIQDPEFSRFQQYYSQEEGSIWIIKPGEGTNRGIGIRVESSLDAIKEIVSNTTTKTGHQRTYIIQRYIDNPLLYKGRKFDIRCYALITNYNGNLQAYFYQDGYLRTACKPFMLSNIANKFAHLTNDAVQKNSADYGKNEDGNKLSYSQFQQYLVDDLNLDVNFNQDILPQIRQLVMDSIRSAGQSLDPYRKQFCFEIMGYDFMIDNNLTPWLIEINTNPCLALSSDYLSQLIPKMLNNAFTIAVDTLFPPNKETLSFENRFELIYQEFNRPAEQIQPASDGESSASEDGN